MFARPYHSWERAAVSPCVSNKRFAVGILIFFANMALAFLRRRPAD